MASEGASAEPVDASVDKGAGSISSLGAVPSGTVTFLFTDIEGPTRLLERLRGRYAEVLADQRRILREAFAAWHGHEIDTQGDSFFVAFARASDALSCAVAAQGALGAWTWPADVEVSVRMGIHTGEPILDAAGYVGMDVHRAARVASAGHGGQILVSGTVHDLVVQDLPAGIELRDLGSHRLKDLRGATRLYQLVGAGLRADFEPIVTREADEPPPTPGQPPYRGLQAFGVDDANLFFGREEAVTGLVEQLKAARFLALVGASGSGKSSILRAGVIPALRDDESTWSIHLLTPTAHPLEALADAVTVDASAREVATLVEDLRSNPRSLAAALRRRARHGSHDRRRVLIAVDQLEEIFTLCRDASERLAFLDNLIYASGLDEASANTAPGADQATVIVTLRADFYAFLAPYPLVREAAAASQRYVGAMSADELRRAIEQPAQRGDWDFTPGLVDLLLRDVGDEPGALPLLSHALLETWHRRRGTTMTLRSYAESGEVKGAIARTADRVYGAELTEAQRRIARNLFVRLTELGEGTQDTRRRARLGELLPNDETQAAAVRTVIGALVDARLVTVAEDTIEVAHEALIREWPTLREWLRADREQLRLHRRLTEAAREWELAGFDESLLYRGVRLAQARESTAYRGVLNEPEQRFLEAAASLEQREEADREQTRQRELAAAQALAAAESRRAEESAKSAAGLRRRAVMLAGALVAAAVLAAVAVVLARQSDSNATLAAERERDAQGNAALADQSAQEARDNAALAALREEEARDSQALAEGRATELAAQRLGADALQLVLRGQDPELTALLALQGLRAGYTLPADIALQRAGREVVGQLFSHDGPVAQVAVTADGQTMFTISAGNVIAWDIGSGEEIGRLGKSALGDFAPFELSADGSLVVAGDDSGETALFRLSSGESIGVDRIDPDCPALRSWWQMSADSAVVVSYRDAGGAPAFNFVSTADCEPIASDIVQRGVSTWAVNRDATLLAVAAEETSDTGAPVQAFMVWDVATGQQIQTFGGGFPITSMTFSEDDALIVTANWDGTATLFDIRTGELLNTFRGHAGEVTRAILSSDGTRLLTVSSDGTVRQWDTATGSEVRRIVPSSPVQDLALSPDGRYLFIGSEDGTLRRWSTDPTGDQYTYRAGASDVTGLAFSPDGGRLASASGQSLRVFNLATQRIVVDQALQGVKLVAFSPGGDLLLVTSSSGVTLRNAETGEETHRLSDQDSAAWAAGFTPDGETVLAPFGVVLSSYETLSGTPLVAYNPLEPVQVGVLSRDGALVAASHPGGYSIFDVVTGRFITGIWLEREEQPEITEFGLQVSAVDLAFTNDSEWLVTGDRDLVVRARDIASASVVLEMRGHTSPIRQVRLSTDGRFALSASDDGTARLWNLETGDLVRIFAGRNGRAVTGIAIAPDGKTVAIGSSDGTVIVSSTAESDLAAEVCRWLSRDLTDDERTAYGIEGTTPTCP